MERVDPNPLGAVFRQGRARSFFESGLKTTFETPYYPLPVRLEELMQRLREQEELDAGVR